MAPLFHLVAGAPDPVAPFSHAVEVDDWVFVTGQMPFKGTSIDEPYPQGIEAQTRQVFRNLETVLRGIGLDLAEGRELGDVTTLRDPTVTEAIKEKVSAGEGDE